MPRRTPISRSRACATASIYGLRHAPLRDSEKDAREEKRPAPRGARLRQSRHRHQPTTGSTTQRPAPPDPRTCSSGCARSCVIVDLENDVYRLGLRSRHAGAIGSADLSSRHSRGARRFPRAPRQDAGRALRRGVRSRPLRRQRLGQGEPRLRRRRYRGARRRGSKTIPTWLRPSPRPGLRAEARRDGPQSRRDADRPVRRPRARTIPCSSAWT